MKVQVLSPAPSRSTRSDVSLASFFMIGTHNGTTDGTSNVRCNALLDPCQKYANSMLVRSLSCYQEVDIMAEIIETLEGCVEVLELMLEDRKDSRLTLIKGALMDCIIELDDLWNNGIKKEGQL